MVKQAINHNRKNANKPITKKRRKLPRDSKGKVIRKHPKFGTSKLEDDFAHDFLDRLKINYVRQFEARDIGRFYDFYLPESNIILEIDGSYYHAEGLTYDEMNPMQKKNHRVDELKNKWALMHGIPIYRIWESDIRNNPEKVLKELKEKIVMHRSEQLLEEKKNKRHKNKIK